MRVRGLKQLHIPLTLFVFQESHPMRVRGLKLHVIINGRLRTSVAPHAGAWIETYNFPDKLVFREVAPHAGAWIETSRTELMEYLKGGSHPMRVRGLKRPGKVVQKGCGGRTPCGCVD